MNILYCTYLALTSAFAIFLIPAFWLHNRITGRYRKHFGERLGFVPAGVVKGLQGSPRIWFHAVSLGEVRVAAAIIEALRRTMPRCSIVLSTTTEHGRNLARETFGREIPVFYAPIDFIGSVRKALLTVQPHLMVFLETEIWPAWLFECRRMGIKTALINGRISAKSIGGYLKVRLFFREVLKNFDIFSMVLSEDAARIRAMGADPLKTEINGNAKYDLLGSQTDPEIIKDMRRILNLDGTQPVFVAGSTRSGEEAIIIDAYKVIREAFPDAILIIVPRHIERTGAIASLVENSGFKYQLRTQLEGDGERRTAPVVIINTFGELFRIYSVATVVFCGASLVPLGGQNPLEPAVWGKPVLYGPFMENFLDAKGLLESAGGGMQVSTTKELAEKALLFFKDPGKMEDCGIRAREAVLKNRGAAQRHALVIERLWKRTVMV